MRQTRSASRQLEALLDHFIEKERLDAADKLERAVATATAHIEADPQSGLPAPRPYPALARLGFHWIKVHRYWFGWSITKGYPVLTNVHFDTASIEGRVAPDEDEELPL